MQTTNYFLLDDQERHEIVHGEAGVRMHVFGLEADITARRPAAVYFSEDHGDGSSLKRKAGLWKA
jgi:hypothetical protein